MLLSKCEGRGVGPAAEPGQHSPQDSLPPYQPPSQHLHTQHLHTQHLQPENVIN